jgi:cysteine-rich repeat protein
MFTPTFGASITAISFGIEPFDTETVTFYDMSNVAVSSTGVSGGDFPLDHTTVVSAISSNGISRIAFSGSSVEGNTSIDNVSVTISPCGDGTVDFGEQCDDGNTANGDCCSSTCQYEAYGSACPADSDVCTDDVCDGAGACGVFNTAPCIDNSVCTQTDQCNGSGTCVGSDPLDCDDGDACTADSCDQVGGCVNDDTPATGCLTSAKSLLLLKNNATDDSKDKLTWKWLKGAETSLEDLGVPTGTTNYTLCLYAGTSSASVAIPAGSSWQLAGTKGFKYKNPAGTPDGAQKASLKSGAAGKAKALVKGKGTDLPDTLVPALPLPVTVQLVNDTNTCFEAVYDSGNVIKNDAKRFKAKK